MTLRLDRFTGCVSLLVQTKEGDSTWEEMRILNRPVVADATHARFQIFSFGLAARYAFLIDTQTGRTWQTASVKEKTADGTEQESVLWQPLPE